MSPNISLPTQQIALGRFGGLYTEADPRDLPLGSCPRCHDVDFLIGGVDIRPGLTKAINSYTGGIPSGVFTYLRSSLLSSVGAPPLKAPVTLAGSSDGKLWQELLTLPGLLQPIYTGILNNSRAISETVAYTEFIGLADLDETEGTDQPRTWNGQYLDRVSQVGPGAGPAVSSGGNGNISISTITQPNAMSIQQISSSAGGLGNVYVGPILDQDFPVQSLFTISGVSESLFNGSNFIVQTYVTSSGRYPVIVFFPNPNANFTVNNSGTIQSQLATLTTNGQPHNLMAGQTFVISDTGTAYDGTWTVFQVISPTQLTFNASTIVGNYPGTFPDNGVLGTSSGLIAAGQRYCICLFIMRNGDITPASPPVGFITAASDTFVNFTNIPIGPPECVGRILAVTPANAGIGGPYYYIADGSGVVGPTVINDNVTSSLADTGFSDAVLTAGINVTQVGNNALQQREVGEFVKPVLYAGRVTYLGERTKVDNLYNLTFDGGTQQALGSGALIPSICGWTKQLGYEGWISLVTSPIYGESLAITNLGITTLNPTGTPYASLEATLGQFDINTDPFGVSTIQPNTSYSVRFTAWTSQLGASLIPAIVNDGLGTILGPSVPVLTTSPQEYVGTFSLPTGTLPTLDLVVIPYNIAPGQTVYLDRIEIYPSQQPVYANQLGVSYIDNFQQLDSQTGALDTSLYSSDPLTNQFKFINTLYMTTKGLTLSTNDVAGSEPSGWTISEVSNAVGCLGPLAADVGEEYVLVADRHGAYVFDGGNHIKFSQEIQQIWESIYWPSAATAWIKNDLEQQRILIGVPMSLPNAFFPDAAPNAAPTYPNIILMCSVLGLANGADIGASPGVHVSAFTGNLIARDASRKWTGWYIASPTVEWIDRPDGSEQLWVASAGVGENVGVPQIYYLNDAALSDDLSGVIDELYCTYGFGDEQTTQALQLGQAMHSYQYMTATIEGNGNFVLTLYPESLGTNYPTSQPPVQLATPTEGDTNLPLNVRANRVFLQFAVDGAVNSNFNLKRVVLGSVSDPRIPVSGQ